MYLFIFEHRVLIAVITIEKRILIQVISKIVKKESNAIISKHLNVSVVILKNLLVILWEKCEGG